MHFLLLLPPTPPQGRSQKYCQHNYIKTENDRENKYFKSEKRQTICQASYSKMLCGWVCVYLVGFVFIAFVSLKFQVRKGLLIRFKIQLLYPYIKSWMKFYINRSCIFLCCNDWKKAQHLFYYICINQLPLAVNNQKEKLNYCNTLSLNLLSQTPRNIRCYKSFSLTNELIILTINILTRN